MIVRFGLFNLLAIYRPGALRRVFLNVRSRRD
jgi:hypothetical protein